MWWSRVVSLMLLISISACSKPEKPVEETYPFSKTTKIEFISYPVRYEWDTIRDGERKYLWYLVENKKLVNSSGIKERIFLNQKQRKDLLSALFTPRLQSDETMVCFDPRHAILFYNEKSEIIADIEICFDCERIRQSKEFKKSKPFNPDMADLKAVFEEAGIKYFGEERVH
ncbi:MAG: hypothetical protein ACO1N9_03190 [Flavobacterium sp.]